MLPFGDATSPDATTVPAGMGTIVGLGKAALTGPGVATCEIAGLGVAVGVGGGAVGVPVVVAEWWPCVMCALAWAGIGRHPASATVMSMATPMARTVRRFMLWRIQEIEPDEAPRQEHPPCAMSAKVVRNSAL
jgi:hypothetical protein